jgi:hypothetical protein
LIKKKIIVTVELKSTTVSELNRIRDHWKEPGSRRPQVSELNKPMDL